MMRWILLLFLQTLFFSKLQGQEVAYGDQSVVEEVKKSTSWIYKNKDETRFLLTKKKLQHTKSSGTNLVVHLLKGEVNRIITTNVTKKGKKSTEWYFYNDQLIFVYDVFEYFNEVKPKNSWENFKGLPSWESRYYFVNGKLKFHKHKGKKGTNTDLTERQLLKDAKSILNYIEAKLNQN